MANGESYTGNPIALMKHLLSNIFFPFNGKRHANNSSLPDYLNNNAITVYDGRPIKISFLYVSANGRSSQREVKIERIIKKNCRLYLHGHCYISNNIRTFRLDRIEDRIVTNTSTGESGLIGKIFRI